VIKETAGQITLIPKNVPEELRELDQWIVWRYEERDGDWTKIPYVPYTPYRASSTNPTDWRPFDEAADAYRASVSDSTRPYGGVGFVFTEDDPYAGLDLDHARNPKTGEIAPWVQEILERVEGGYVEISPSGRGIHIIVRAEVRNGGIRKGNVEMYSRGRYFTVTGNVL